jgi:hypothetical protein
MRIRIESLVLLLAALACLAPSRAFAQAQQSVDTPEIQLAQNAGHNAPGSLDDSHVTTSDGSLLLTDKQKKSILKANLEKSKRDAAELSTLARQLRDELNKPNADPLSSESQLRIEKIEKLAKKIRDELKVD